MTRTYEIKPRLPEIGGGWNLRFLEDGEEAGGGYFPPVPSNDEAYLEAMDEGENWAPGCAHKED